jgi:hypothetical protein
VTIIVLDKVYLPRAPRVVEAVVESPCNIVDDTLHSLLVLRHRSLHEPTNIADGECLVRSCVGEVAKAPQKTPVRLYVNLSSVKVRDGLQSVRRASSTTRLA